MDLPLEKHSRSRGSAYKDQSPCSAARHGVSLFCGESGKGQEGRLSSPAKPGIWGICLTNGRTLTSQLDLPAWRLTHSSVPLQSCQSLSPSGGAFSGAAGGGTHRGTWSLSAELRQGAERLPTAPSAGHPSTHPPTYCVEVSGGFCSGPGVPVTHLNCLQTHTDHRWPQRGGK